MCGPIMELGTRSEPRWAAKATELNRHMTRMKIRGSVFLERYFSPPAGGLKK